VQDWPYSLFYRDVRRGIFPLHWAGEAASSGIFRERGDNLS
jgi:putative transposase